MGGADASMSANTVIAGIRRSAAMLLLLLPSSGFVLAADAPCNPEGDVQFICGPHEAEDLVLVPGTRWIIASGGSNGTNFYLIDSVSRAWRALPFGASQGSSSSRCPGPPAPASLKTHGLHIRASGPGRALLHVVGHGAREAIEAFEVDTSGDAPVLKWTGCIPLPEGMAGNSVVALADGTVLTTVLFLPGTTFADAMNGKPTGVVLERRPGRAQFEVVRGTELPANNGLEVSPDGRELYVVSSGLRTLVAFSRDNPAKQLRSTRTLPFTPDNVHLGPDGALYTAGMASDVPECGGVPGPQHDLQKLAACPRGSIAAAVDRSTLKDTIVLETPALRAFSNVTLVLPVGTDAWLGTFAGDRIAIGKLRRR
jgi:SMP-30/Gluconolactonase/LRE-like region